MRITTRLQIPYFETTYTAHCPHDVYRQLGKMDDKQAAEYSGSSSDEEEEEEYEEEEEERTKDETKPQNSNKAKKKRKHKPPGHRRNIKSKYDTIEDLNPEALSAQTEELERIRRLELQQSLISSMTHNTSHDVPVTSHETISNSRVDSSSSNERSVISVLVYFIMQK